MLDKIILHGFKSIRECNLELKKLNILIGPNGAGKSNFIAFLKMFQKLLQGGMRAYVGKQGGPDALLYFGRKTTKELKFDIYAGIHQYSAALEATNDNRLFFVKESLTIADSPNSADILKYFQSAVGEYESKLSDEVFIDQFEQTVAHFSGMQAYHFHDTGETALVKRLHGINYTNELSPDAANLGAFLYHLQKNYTKSYKDIVATVQLVAPFFYDFALRPYPDNKEQIELEWTERGSDIPFKASALSDGTLRFICLATVLLQPAELQPETILIDEPELGLHPAAISMLAGMLRSVSTEKQLIVSTQSTDLLNEFQAEDIVVADRKDGQTYLHRLDADALGTWLAEYSLGELWYKNLLGGRPAR